MPKGELSLIEKAKRSAAFTAVDEFVESGQKVGIGSGSTVVYAVERIVQRAKENNLSVICVPTSFQARALIVNGGLTLGDLDRYPLLDVVIDGADEVDKQLNLIKGGGGCQTLEKLVASCGKKLVIIADYRKQSSTLGQQWKKGVPLEVIPAGRVPVMLAVKSLGGVPVLRMGVNKAGPVVTDNGNLIIDAKFGEIEDPAVLNLKLKMTPGIVETGLFVGMAVKAFFGQEDGTVKELVGNTRSPL